MTETDVHTTPAEGSQKGRKHARFQKLNRVHRREVDKAAEAMAEKHDLPLPPGKDLKWNQAVEYFGLLSPEMWSHVMVYVYRLKPRIIRQLKDPDASNYIDCISQPFNLEYFITTHGGGTYLLQATDIEKKRPETNLFRCIFEIDMNQHEPKLNYEELDVNHRENMAYIRMLQHKGILNDKGQLVTNTQQTPATGNGGINTEVIKEILGFVSKLNSDQQENLRAKLGATGQDPLTKSIGDILLEKMKQDDPTKQVAMMTSLLSSLKEVVGTSKGSDSTALYDRIITMQAEHNKTVLQLIERITTQHNRPHDPEAADNDLDRIDKLFSIVERFRGMGAGAGGPRSGWDIGLDYLRELAVPGLQMMQNFMAAKNGQPMTPVTAPRNAAFDPYRDQAAMRNHANQINAQAGPGAGPPVSQDLMLLQQFAPLLVNALNNGTPGYDFADYLTGLMGTATHAMIAAQGEDPLVSTALTIPALAVFGETRLRTFAHEFIHYEELLKDNATEDAVN